MHQSRRSTTTLLLLIVSPAILQLQTGVYAGVTRIEIRERLPFAEGRSFVGVGPYQRLLGRAHFAVDPQAAANRRVIDLDLAPTNADGLVEFRADVEILSPVDLGKGNGTLLYGVNNRGGRRALNYFNNGADHFLMRKGYIVVWSGWIAELLPGGNRLRLEVPAARDAKGRPITGKVRTEMTPDKTTDRIKIVSGGSHGGYPPTEHGLKTATLSCRLRAADPRTPIPRSEWQLETKPVDVDGELRSLPTVELVLSAGFQPGHIYELIYEAEGSLVQGLGLAGIRDLVSFLRYDTTEKNPIRSTDGTPAARRTLGWGISQSGRCLRQLLYDGFNADEQGRIVFDGLIPHVAGGGLGFFNHRFASPTRYNTQHADHDYPCDVFPFAYGPETDLFTGREEGILDRARASKTVPKVMHIQTSAEYWHRSGSLVHTDPLGKRDSQIPPEVRIYAIGGAQHGAGRDAPGKVSNAQLPANPTDYRPLLRGLLTAMDRWVRDGTEPPPSRYPRIAGGTLVGWREPESGWLALPGVKYPEVIQQPSFRDYGPEFLSKRRITLHPPIPRGDYRVLVPKYGPGPDNNELGMLLLPSVAVPVATLTGWNLRNPKIGAPSELMRLQGAYIAFPRTAAERTATGDPRPALLERYRNFEAYMKQFEAAARRLVDERCLLAEDVPMLVQRARKNDKLFASEEHPPQDADGKSAP